jgi:hypothetical protein
MKKIRFIYLILVSGIVLFSCSEKSLDKQSIFDTESTQLFPPNDFDNWILKNYTKPYNIDLKYRFEDKESNNTYNLAPVVYDKAIALAKMIKYLWIESYAELFDGNEIFIKTYCPKVIFMVGSPAYNSSGSIVLGTAEGGLKITLYNVNSINLDKINIEQLNYWYFKTMHHEFAHILHQTKNYPPEFNLISNDYQSSSWVNVTDQDALDMGFVSPYASSETQEDFVEIISIYVTNTKEYWDTNIIGNASDEGKAKIQQKLSVVKDYLTTSWGIDLDKLRDIVQRRSADITTLDLKSLND